MCMMRGRGLEQHSILTNECSKKTTKSCVKNTGVTLFDLSDEFPQIARTCLFGTVIEKLDYHRFCAQWLSRLPTTDSVNSGYQDE